MATAAEALLQLASPTTSTATAKTIAPRTLSPIPKLKPIDGDVSDVVIRSKFKTKSGRTATVIISNAGSVIRTSSLRTPTRVQNENNKWQPTCQTPTPEHTSLFATKKQLKTILVKDDDSDSDDDDDRCQTLLPRPPPEKPNQIGGVFDNEMEPDNSRFDHVQSLVEFCFEEGWNMMEINFLINKGLGGLNLPKQDKIKLLLYACSIESDFNSNCNSMDKGEYIIAANDVTVAAATTATSTETTGTTSTTSASALTKIDTSAAVSSISNATSIIQVAETITTPTAADVNETSTAIASILDAPVLTRRKQIPEEDLIPLEEDPFNFKKDGVTP